MKCLVLDGGFSNELKKYCSFNIGNEPLWTSKALKDEQNAIVAAHCAYVRAGADVIETATFQASVQGFKKQWNLTEKESIHLIATSVNLARTAIAEVKKEMDRVQEPLVAGSIGSYGASLCDGSFSKFKNVFGHISGVIASCAGSEFTGKFMDTVTEAELIHHHLPRIRGLVEGNSDLLLVETIPSLAEAKIVLDIVKKHYPSTKVWLSFSTMDALCTPRSELLQVAFENVTTMYPQVTGFGINCCSPEIVQTFIDSVMTMKKILLEKEGRDIRIIVYPNAGDDWVAGQGWVKKDSPPIETYVKKWADSGASVIGGCCQIGPEDITKIRTIVDEWNATHEET